jgi:hypothetical protein
MIMVGKIKLFIFFVAVFLCKAASLEVTDMHDQPIDVVSLNAPFFATVNLNSELDSKAENCVLHGLDEFSVLDTSKSVNMLIGSNQKKYKIRYKLSADKLGRYTIGPATIETDSGQVETNSVQIDVKVGLPYLKLYRQGESSVVLGEQFKIYAKFYFDDQQIIPKLKLPEELGANVKLLKAVESRDGQEEFEGQQVYFREWILLVKSKSSGVVKADPLNVLFDTTEMQTFGFFDMPSTQTHRIKSNFLEIKVDPLPNPELDAVGLFKSFKASLNSTAALVGDAVVLTLQLEGDVDLEDISYSNLQLPEALSFYESKSNVVDNKKDFEFVVQGQKEGTYKIPSQTFTYFDTNKRRCSVLKSNELVLEIKPKAIALAQNVEDAQEDLIPVYQEFRTISVSALAIPFKYFLLMLFLPLFYLLINLFRKRKSLNLKPVDKIALAKKKITKAKYASELILILQDAGLDKASISEEWVSFVDQLEQARYSDSDQQNLEDLKLKSIQLLDLLIKL